ncbi:hypothetical protein CANMA_000598 [Candida margitis]|uniref:uncharacterized protein n=1 Tax=Candida margitis TaxID=1775924 RepID=UPI00222631BA|nr:uncharacterized protein CANMA_000598 [Candida margitis]KAI5970358.1 hypothetical protein CANMA_000598 [Candida margitis]
MKSVVTFIELFQELNYNVSEKRLSSSGAISLSKREIFAINTSLNGLTEGTPVTTDQVAAITGCIGELCNSIIHELADGTQAKTLDIQLQVRDALHFNWLVQYLSALHKKRKLAINSVAEHADSHNQGRDTTLVDEKTRLQKFEARRNKNDSPVARHGRKDKITRSKRKKLSDEWELTSDIEFSFEESSTVHRKREQKIVYQQQIDEFVEKTKDRPSKEVELVAKASRQEIQKEEDTCHGDVHNPSDALQHQFDQNAKELSFSSNLFVSEGSSRSQPSDLSSSVLVPKERIDRVTKTQASTLIPDTETPVRTSTPVNAEFTEFPTITDKTSDTEGTLDVMNDALKLFSSNLLNKLKRVEFEVLHKRNDLQVQVDKEYKKIERMQRAKLKEIQEYCRNELDKIV